MGAGVGGARSQHYYHMSSRRSHHPLVRRVLAARGRVARKGLGKLGWGIDLSEELRRPVPTLQDVPPFMRAAVRRALSLPYPHPRSERPVGLLVCRGWKLI